MSEVLLLAPLVSLWYSSIGHDPVLRMKGALMFGVPAMLLSIYVNVSTVLSKRQLGQVVVQPAKARLWFTQSAQSKIWFIGMIVCMAGLIGNPYNLPGFALIMLGFTQFMSVFEAREKGLVVNGHTVPWERIQHYCWNKQGDLELDLGPQWLRPLPNIKVKVNPDMKDGVAELLRDQLGKADAVPLPI